MSRQILRLSWFIFLFVLALVACKIPAPATQTQDSAAAYTLAAQTIIAELTKAAPSAPVLATPQVTPPPGETPAGATAPVETPAAATEAAPASPTPEASATALTPSPTPPPADTATATTPASDPKAGLGSPDFRDAFKNDDNWSLYDNKQVVFELGEDRLRMIARQADSSDWFMLSWPELQDFYLEMTATPKECSGRDRYGLVFRSIKDGDVGYVGYQFGATCDGQYSLRIWNGNKHIVLINWTESEYLLKGTNETNRLGVLVDGKKISLYANGNLLTQISDDRYDEGRFGLFVGSVNTEDFTVNVNEIAYWELP